MNVKFDVLIAKMPKLFRFLEAQLTLTRDNLTGVPERGVYVFYENDKPIYVGRSNRLKQRIQEHGRPSSTHNSAPFAFNIAKKIITRRHNISENATREELTKVHGFTKFFNEAKARVAQMKIRVIPIEDQVAQALFEIYAALKLNTTKYNDFGTH